MKICLVAEGCYPYTVGGVSSWVHNMIRSFPEHEFVLLAIVSNRAQRGRYVYELPENLKSVYEVYLEDYDYTDNKKSKKVKLSKKEYDALRSLILNMKVDWDTIFDLFQKNISVNNVLMGEDFLNIITELYEKNYPEIVFSDFLWTMRSIYLPMFLILKADVPEADLYHCVATGYAGILGALAKYKHDCGLLISEHGIYTREREEEIIKADWVKGIYKNIWIEQFRKMSQIAYDRADIVTSLFEYARGLQLELGCPKEKTVVTPNGINEKLFMDITRKIPEARYYFDLAAVLRIAQIKDVKTLINAFSYALKTKPKMHLWIMGPDDEEEYAQECKEMVKFLNIENNVIFTGRVDVREYLGKMDCTILTSISEGQPLTMLEGFAAHLPAIATDVGNCRGLIYGENDDFGDAGIITHIMNVEEIKDAIIYMASNVEKRMEMGENGYKRLMNNYRLDQMIERYRDLYNRFDSKEG